MDITIISCTQDLWIHDNWWKHVGRAPECILHVGGIICAAVLNSGSIWGKGMVVILLQESADG